MFVCMHAGTKHHFFDVSFAPKYFVKDDPKDYLDKPFTLMYESQKFCTYQKYYEKTVSASKCSIDIPMIYRTGSELLKVEPVEILDKDVVRLVSSPLYYSSVTGIPFPKKILVKPEIARNQYFSEVIYETIKDDYHLGPIDIPVLNKNMYSYYGRSRNDVSIIHKDNFLTAGLLTWNTEDDELHDPDAQWDVRGGTIELKLDHDALQQTMKEMMCLAGDLTAKALLMGKILDRVYIYGINAKYNQPAYTRLLILSINFPENKADSQYSVGGVSIHQGLNWLLNKLKG